MPVEFKVTRYQRIAPGLDGYITLEWRGEGQWAICDRFGSVYNTKGEWEHEPLPSNRDEAFFKRARYPLHEAMLIASDLTGDE